MKIGIEKEFLMFDNEFKPLILKKENCNENLIHDYADHQFEIVTKPCSNVFELVSHFEDLLNEQLIIENKMWPTSIPGNIDYKVTFDQMNQEEKKYRTHLSKKYDKKMLLTSGIHLNISIHENEEKNFELLKKVYVYLPIIMQFVSFSPDLNNKQSLSTRNSIKNGYSNEDKLDIEFTNFKTFNFSIKKAILENKISSPKEIYSKVRLKGSENKSYLELRFIDLNPFNRMGIDIDTLIFLEQAIKLIDKFKLNSFDQKQNFENIDLVANYGLNKNLELVINGKKATLSHHTNLFFNHLLPALDNNLVAKYSIEQLYKQYLENDLPINKFLNILEKYNLDYDSFGKKNYFQKEQFNLTKPSTNFELSTKILIDTAIKNNYNVTIEDETQNVITIDNNFFIQATKTNFDHYANILLLENKYMTKKILAKRQINVPQGGNYTSIKQVNYQNYQNHSIVIKPVNTNFGLGITILEKHDEKSFYEAVNFAFKYDKRILIEQFFVGQEYRFLVIDDQLISIVKRIPANVIGDGKCSIKQLVEMKNKHPYRGTNYQKPVELIKISDFEKNFLAKENLSIDSIPLKGQRVFLRNNSNISTGGDSAEVINQIPSYFKKISIDAVKAMNVKICGIDMIIDPSGQNYCIIEANFNPAIHMHTYPFYGIGINPATAILNLIKKSKKN